MKRGKTYGNAGGTATLLYLYQQISGTRQRRWRMIKEAERYLDYARVDWEYRK